MSKIQPLAIGISSQQKQNDYISPSSSQTLERAADGNLLPEARKKLATLIEEHIRKRGQVNVSEIARIFRVSRETVRKLTQAVLMQWRSELSDQALAQIQWLQGVVDDIDNDPTSFTVQKIELIKLKAVLLGKAHSLQKYVVKSDGSKNVAVHLHTHLITTRAPTADQRNSTE